MPETGKLQLPLFVSPPLTCARLHAFRCLSGWWHLVLSEGQKQLPCSKWSRSICQCKPKREADRKQIGMEEKTRKGTKTEEGGRQNKRVKETWRRAISGERDQWEKVREERATKTARKDASYQKHNSFFFKSEVWLHSLPILRFTPRLTKRVLMDSSGTLGNYWWVLHW